MHSHRRNGLLAFVVVALATLGVSTVVSAAGNTISVSPATTTKNVGASFTVSVTANGSVAISGAGAALKFDNTKLQLTAIAKDATEVANGVTFAGFPTPSTLAAFITDANTAGQTGTIAWTYTDGASSEPAGAEHGIFSATFTVTASGTSSLDAVVVPGVGGLLDGTAASYGDSLTGITTNAGAVVTAGASGSPSPSPSASASASASPSPSASAGGSASPSPSAASSPTPRSSARPSPTPAGGAGGATITPPPTAGLPVPSTPAPSSLLFVIAGLAAAVTIVLLIATTRPARRRR